MEAGTVDDDRRAVAIGQLLSAGDDILGLGVDDVGSAVLEGSLQLGLVDVHDDDLAGAVQVDDAQHAAAQSAGTDDHNGVLELQLGTAASLHGDGGGLDHNGILVAQAVGQDINVALGHGHVLAVAAIDVDAADLQVLTNIGTALAAGIAGAAGSDLVHDDAVADLDLLGVVADFLNHTDDLVADDAGIGGGGVGAVVDAHVRAADAGGLDLDQDVVLGVDGGLIHIDDA